MIISPIGRDILVAGSPDQEEVVAAEINLDDVAEARRKLPFWRDRRSDQYSDLIL